MHDPLFRELRIAHILLQELAVAVRLAQIQRAEICKERLVDEHLVDGEVERLLAWRRRARERPAHDTQQLVCK